MTATRILLAGILGGIAMFIWSFIAHDLLPLGEVGIHQFQNEDAMLDALKTNLDGANGLYHFPGFQAGPNATRQEKQDAMKRAMEKAASGPSGILLYHSSREFSFVKLLGVEFVTEVVEAIIVVLLLAQTRIESFFGRVSFVFFAGVLAAIATNVPYWNCTASRKDTPPPTCSFKWSLSSSSASSPLSRSENAAQRVPPENHSEQRDNYWDFGSPLRYRICFALGRSSINSLWEPCGNKSASLFQKAAPCWCGNENRPA